MGTQVRTLRFVVPGGKPFDIKDKLIDLGYAPKEGYWSARCTTAQPGLHTIVHTMDNVVSYAPVRSIRSAKCYFVASKSLENVPRDNPGFDKPLEHAFELVPELQHSSEPIKPRRKRKRVSLDAAVARHSAPKNA